MKQISLTIFLVLSFSIQARTSSVDKELNVINDIFIELAQKLPIYHVNDLIPPPPLPPIYNENNEIVGFDSLAYKNQQIEYDKALDILRGKNIDTTYMVVAISDLMISKGRYSDDFNVLESKRNDYDEIITLYKSGIKKDKRFQIEKINEIERFEFMYSSDLPRNVSMSEYQLDFQFGGILSFSRIYFNADKNRALFYCSYYCGEDCGTGNMVFVKKLNNKWVIDDFTLLWIS